MRTYRTSIIFAVADSGTEHERDMSIQYTVTPGSNDYWDGQMWQQGWDAEVEIHSAKFMVADAEWIDLPEWLFGYFYSDKDLRDALLRDADEAAEYARDQADDAKREEQMLERGR